MTKQKHIVSKAIHAVKWSTLSEILSKLLTPVVFIVLARILSPEDYGVAAAGMIVISFSQIFWEAGLAKTLIQRQDNVEGCANIVFWTNIILSLFIYGLICLFAKEISNIIFKNAQIARVLYIQGLIIPISSLYSVQTAIFQKNFKYRVLFNIRLISIFVSAVLSILFALKGFGYWSLIFGSLASSVCQCIISWVTSEWRPQISYNTKLAQSLFSFSIWVMGSSFLSWFYLWVDTFFVGAFFDVNSMGLYRVGGVFNTTLFTIFFSAIAPVLYSLLSHLQKDVNFIRKQLLDATLILTFFTFPLGAGIFIGQNQISNIVFGNKWEGVSEVLGWYALMLVAASLVRLNGEAYRAVGRPDIETKVMLISLIIYLPSYLISVGFGFTAFLVTRFVCAIGSLVVHFYFLRKILSINTTEVFLKIRWVILSFFIMILTVPFVIKLVKLSDITSLIGIGVCVLLIHTAVGFLPESKNLVKKIEKIKHA